MDDHDGITAAQSPQEEELSMKLFISNEAIAIIARVVVAIAVITALTVIILNGHERALARMRDLILAAEGAHVIKKWTCPALPPRSSKD